MALAATLLAAEPAHATTLTVNSTADPGDGNCAINGCTLREAINEANDTTTPARTPSTSTSRGAESRPSPRNRSCQTYTNK